MMRAWVFQSTGVSELTEPGTLADHLGHDDEVLWLDVEQPSAQDFDRVADEFSFHPLALETAKESNQRAHVRPYDGHTLLVAYAGADPADLAEIDIFVGPNWVVTFHQHPSDRLGADFDHVRERFQRAGVERLTVGLLVYEILDHVVDRYFEMTDDIEDRIDDAEEAIWKRDRVPSPSVQRNLLELRKELITLRRAVVPLRDVVSSLLHREFDFVDTVEIVYFENLFEHVVRAVDQIDTARELLGNAADADLAVAANDMNVVMKKMTSWGAILLGSSLIAGVYGMNFQVIPGSDREWGFVMAIGSMALLTVTLALWFKKKDWL